MIWTHGQPWTQMLLAELARPEVAATAELLDGEKRAMLRTFLSQQACPTL